MTGFQPTERKSPLLPDATQGDSADTAAAGLTIDTSRREQFQLLANHSPSSAPVAPSVPDNRSQGVSTNGRELPVSALSSMRAVDLGDGRSRVTTQFWSPVLNGMVTDSVVVAARPEELRVQYTPSSVDPQVPNIRITYGEGMFLSITRDEGRGFFSSTVALRSRFTPEVATFSTDASGAPYMGGHNLPWPHLNDAPNIYNITSDGRTTRFTIRTATSDSLSNNRILEDIPVTVPAPRGDVRVGYYAPDRDDRPTEVILDWGNVLNSTTTDTNYLYIIGYEDNSRNVRLVNGTVRRFTTFSRDGRVLAEE